jgi:hypothetical protein
VHRDAHEVLAFVAEGRQLGGPDGSIRVADRTPRLSCLSAEGALLGRCRPVANGAHGMWRAAVDISRARSPGRAAPPDRGSRSGGGGRGPAGLASAREHREGARVR